MKKSESEKDHAGTGRLRRIGTTLLVAQPFYANHLQVVQEPRIGISAAHPYQQPQVLAQAGNFRVHDVQKEDSVITREINLMLLFQTCYLCDILTKWQVRP
jgi:hypothetical protein